MKCRFVLFALFMFSVVVNAQYSKTVTYTSNFYIGANIGLNYFAGDGVQTYLKTNTMDPFGYVGRITIGYTITPVIGVRSFFGHSQYNWPDIYQSGKLNPPYTVLSFGAENITLDLMINLTNWWGGYKNDPGFNLSVFAGGGGALLLKNTAYSKFALIGRGGLQGDFHLNSNLDLNLIGEVNAAGNNYNDYDNGNRSLPYDVFPVLSVGITYYLYNKCLKYRRIPAKK